MLTMVGDLNDVESQTSVEELDNVRASGIQTSVASRISIIDDTLQLDEILANADHDL